LGQRVGRQPFDETSAFLYQGPEPNGLEYISALIFYRYVKRIEIRHDRATVREKDGILRDSDDALT
jgi:hypothetical protein